MAAEDLIYPNMDEIEDACLSDSEIDDVQNKLQNMLATAVEQFMPAGSLGGLQNGDDDEESDREEDSSMEPHDVEDESDIEAEKIENGSSSSIHHKRWGPFDFITQWVSASSHGDNRGYTDQDDLIDQKRIAEEVDIPPKNPSLSTEREDESDEMNDDESGHLKTIGLSSINYLSQWVVSSLFSSKNPPSSNLIQNPSESSTKIDENESFEDDPDERDIDVNDYVYLNVPFIPHFSRFDSTTKKIYKGMNVDFRAMNGKYLLATITAVKGDHHVRVTVSEDADVYGSNEDLDKDHRLILRKKKGVWLHLQKDFKRLARAGSISQRPILRNAMRMIKTGLYLDLNLSYVSGSRQWVTGQVRSLCPYGSGQAEIIYTDPVTRGMRSLFIHLDNGWECAPLGTHTQKVSRRIDLSRIKSNPLTNQLFAWFICEEFGFPKYLKNFIDAEVDRMDMIALIDDSFLSDFMPAIHIAKFESCVDDFSRECHVFGEYLHKNKYPCPLNGIQSLLTKQGIMTWRILSLVIGDDNQGFEMRSVLGIRNERIIGTLFKALELYRNKHRNPEPIERFIECKSDEMEAEEVERVPPPVSFRAAAAIPSAPPSSSVVIHKHPMESVDLQNEPGGIEGHSDEHTLQ